ncbi:hypothetical protein PAP_02540 [Palaeococcus pacificus DY20341]|uniref:DUF835 domain-containing protein n=1 Tax=Palaeococcus pacificus DY20341 TaxID=1343739 RepID=A0A075LS27_9EURY|nr:DUF835 domain-containing protein [Palaeococcus pacificus]AIF68936.1 hypothetical protein PAP_02540 [Palaeococcus pacificus DY20341]
MEVPVALIVAFSIELVLLVTLIISLKYRRSFIQHYPQLERAYDYMMIGWFFAILARSVFLSLDIRDVGNISIDERIYTIHALGNILFLIALMFLLAGWLNIINSVLRRYELIPVVEFGAGEMAKIKAPTGVYICNNRRKAYALFLRLLHGRAGLIISRTHPAQIKKELKVEKTPVLWITKVEGEGNIHPTRLPYLISLLVNFMKKDETNKIVLFDAFEYLALENGFEAMFKFITTLKDYALTNNATVLLVLEEEFLTKNEVALLKRELPLIDEVS